MCVFAVIRSDLMNEDEKIRAHLLDENWLSESGNASENEIILYQPDSTLSLNVRSRG